MAPWDWPYTAYAVESDGGEIVVHTDGGYGYGRDLIVYRTRDGVTWDKWIQHTTVRGEAQACLGATCYRIVPGHLRVEESRAGVWTTAWEIPDTTRDRLLRAYPDRNTFRSNADPKEPVESLSVAVTERLVVVANGADGIALRDVRGAWHRLGLGPGGFDKAQSAAADRLRPLRRDGVRLVRGGGGPGAGAVRGHPPAVHSGGRDHAGRRPVAVVRLRRADVSLRTVPRAVRPAVPGSRAAGLRVQQGPAALAAVGDEPAHRAAGRARWCGRPTPPGAWA